MLGSNYHYMDMLHFLKNFFQLHEHTHVSMYRFEATLSFYLLFCDFEIKSEGFPLKPRMVQVINLS